MADRKTEVKTDGYKPTSVYIGPEEGREAKETEAAVVSKMNSTNLAAKAKKATGMPKQEAGEDAGAYGARLRKWRESQASGGAAKQAGALEK